MARTRGGKRRARPRETTPQSLVSYIITDPQLPIEIISDILSRLPVKSLLRFKSVSKSCYKLIQSPTFVKQQLDYSRQNPDPIFSSILSSVYVPETDEQLFRINLIDALDKPLDLDLPFMSGTRGDSPVILGISDGLVCAMMQPSSDIVIFNPLTGDFRKLPPFRGYPQENLFSNHIYFGFGLHGDKGYELFRMMYASFPNDDDDEEVDPLLLGKAYSLTTNTWRTIDVKMGDFEYLEHHYDSVFTPKCNCLPVFVRGVFYWETIDFFSYSVSEYIVCFDIQNEVFNEFDAPDNCFENTWMLSNLKEEVAVVIYKAQTDLDIWVLDEKQRIWTMKFAMKDFHSLSVFPVPRTVTVLGCTSSGKLVVHQSYAKESKLFLYDMSTKTKPTRVSKETIEILPYVNVGGNSSLFLYSESLVVCAGDGVVRADFW